MSNTIGSLSLIQQSGQVCAQINNKLSTFYHPAATRLHMWDIKNITSLKYFIDKIQNDQKT